MTVTDNGIGMTKEQIQAVMSGSGHAAEDAESTGIGLENVINRLRLFYNQENLLSIYSEGAGRGTEVTMRLPIWTDD